MITLYQINRQKSKDYSKKINETFYQFEVTAKDLNQDVLALYGSVATFNTNCKDKAYEIDNLGYENKILGSKPHHSMSCGDIVRHKENFFMCAARGWDKLDININDMEG